MALKGKKFEHFVGIIKLLLVFYNYFNCVQLLLSGFLSFIFYFLFFANERITLPPNFFNPSPLYIFLTQNICIFFLLSLVIPQVKILDYVTIQKQGPYLQQLHIKLSSYMYTGALRLLRVRMTGVDGLQSHDILCAFSTGDIKQNVNRHE